MRAADGPEVTPFARRLLEAATSGDATTTEALIKGGVSVDSKDERDWTALMLASRNGHSNVVDSLLRSGCDRHMLNRSGQTALDIANFWNRSSVIELLGDKTGSSSFTLTSKPHTMDHFFAGSPLDRKADKRKDAEWLEKQQHDDSSLFVVLVQLKPIVKYNEQLTTKGVEAGVKMNIVTANHKDISSIPTKPNATVFLGTETTSHENTSTEIAWFAVNYQQMDDEPLKNVFSGGQTMELMPGCMQLGSREAAIFAHARSLLAWHSRNSFCPTCGSTTRQAEGGYKRVCDKEACPSRKGVHNTCYPRLDSTAIMAVVSADRKRLLLGRGRQFPSGMYSCLAGFIEPGESIEEACRREVREESGILVGHVVYHSSQPWPMPSTLMIGCLAHAETEEIDVDKEELDDARWFTRPEVLQMLHGNHPEKLFVPPEQAIAHALIREWLVMASNL